MIRSFCAHGLEFKYSVVFTHDWCTLIPALDLEYKALIHFSTSKTPAILEKGWNPRLPYDTLKKDLVDIHPTAREYLVRYRNPTQEDEWLPEKDIKNSDKLLRRFRHKRKPKE
ncbi:hypothetical protein O181_053067 [Austropuccinia psidii MF-1]|uniref:Chromo domain-containing protein n=1 Tax=Austropuccinia psidii MF-1 TaxID=1389203 RepID=A0A9Q3E471_9BASI|nr:hypothetical protein [Austropuccinia psidii MF-1]